MRSTTNAFDIHIRHLVHFIQQRGVVTFTDMRRSLGNLSPAYVYMMLREIRETYPDFRQRGGHYYFEPAPKLETPNAPADTYRE